MTSGETDVSLEAAVVRLLVDIERGVVDMLPVMRSVTDDCSVVPELKAVVIADTVVGDD